MADTDDDREVYASPAALANAHTRDELDQLATELDPPIDPSEYATKEDLATAILDRGDQEVQASSGEGVGEDYDADLVPKGDAVEGDEADAEPEDGPPPPLHPDMGAQEHKARVAYEDQINAQVERFLTDARAPVTEAFLAGHTVELTVTDPEADDAEPVDDPYRDRAAADAGPGAEPDDSDPGDDDS